MLSVLLVDDDHLLLDVVKTYLEKVEDTEVYTSESAEEALVMLGKRDFDAIVCDYSMSVSGGLELLKSIRSQGLTTPFILFTGRGSEEVAMEALNSGADYYIRKGIDQHACLNDVLQRIQSLSRPKRSYSEGMTSKEDPRIFDSLTDDCVYSLDGGGRITYANQAFIRRLGRHIVEDDVIGRTLRESGLEEGFCSSLENKCRRVLETGAQTEMDTVIEGPDGIPKHYMTIINPMKDADGLTSGILVIEHDISNRKERESDMVALIEELLSTKGSLMHLEESYRTLFQAMNQSFTLKEALLDEMGAPTDFRFLDVNPAFEKMVGRKSREMIGKSIIETFPDTEPHWIEAFGTVALIGESINFIEYSKVLDSYLQVTAFSPGPLRVACIFDDVTPDVRLKKALAESESRLRLSLDAMNAGIWDWNMVEDRIIFSPQWKIMLGYEDEDIEDNSEGWRRLWHPDDAEHIERTMEKYLASESPEYELIYRLCRKDGDYSWVLARGKVIRNDKGEPVRWVGINIDITPQIVQSECLKVANRKLHLLSSITRHDILNNIFVLKGYLELAEDMEKTPPIAEIHHRMMTAIDSIERQILFTREYEMLGSQDPMWMDLKGILDRLDEPLPTMQKECQGLKIYADPMLYKVFMNLQDNSRRYATPDTEIRISCVENEEVLEIFFEDDGPGIEHEEKGLIFERGHGRNTGLGLFLAKEILSLTGINIEEVGIPGMGATFKLTVPSGRFRRNS